MKQILAKNFQFFFFFWLSPSPPPLSLSLFKKRKKKRKKGEKEKRENILPLRKHLPAEVWKKGGEKWMRGIRHPFIHQLHKL